jgi:cytochrome b involved in lipid metabolism
MDKKILTPVIIGIAVVLIAAGAAYQKSRPEGTGIPSPELNTEPAAVDSYTLAEVATHASAASCWAVVNDSVYDLTTWISKHPGGEDAIKSICGKDGSAAFNNQHSENQGPNDALAAFRIGELAR